MDETCDHLVQPGRDVIRQGSIVARLGEQVAYRLVLGSSQVWLGDRDSPPVGRSWLCGGVGQSGGPRGGSLDETEEVGDRFPGGSGVDSSG